MPTVRDRRKGLLRLWILLAWVLLLPGLGAAETLDDVVNPKAARNEWVSDMAGVVDDETERHLNALIDQLEQKTTAEIAVVTIRRAEGDTPKELATELLQRWGIGKKGRDNGVLVLLVVEERRIEVETGYGVEGVLPDGKVGEILDTRVIPHFKEGDLGGGLLAGVQAMANVLAPSPRSPLPGSPGGPTAPASPKASRTGLRGFGLWVVLGILLLVLTGALAWSAMRNIRYCPQCRKRMRRLTEEQDDAYLSSAQRLEEKLGSVDYHVWRCDDCQISQVEPVLGQSGISYEECPKCGHRTVFVKSCTLMEPTYEREGKGGITRMCRFSNCSYRSTEHYPISRLPRIRSSGVRIQAGGGGGWTSGGWSSGAGGGFQGGGGGSFGGGSSGGGGAGRSW